ncbi:hypothetical protein DRN67_02415 [Candidatus Micrarchaeota archaeon]|nr:MAG: hypothetical protein DRN67_02415 [Candidatus Micrarchaeota archaeon]
MQEGVLFGTRKAGEAGARRSEFFHKQASSSRLRGGRNGNGSVAAVLEHSERQKVVLVVEDLPEVTERIVESISGNGFDAIYTAMNQRDALECLQNLEEAPVLLITDLVFPKHKGEGTVRQDEEGDTVVVLAGIKLIREAKQLFPNMLILVQSSASAEARQLAMEAGADRVISKKELGNLFEMVHEMIDG